jgi:hypothetical protein
MLRRLDFEADIEGIAEHGDSADNGVEQDVPHPQLDPGEAEFGGPGDEIETDQGRDHIADTRHEADEAIEPDRMLVPGMMKRVHQVGERSRRASSSADSAPAVISTAGDDVDRMDDPECSQEA